MMDEETEIAPEQPHSVDEQIRQIVKQNPSLLDKHSKELETVLTTLAALPFKDEIQQVTLLEHVQRLQGNHIIQIFNCGVSPLQKSMAESSAEFLEDVRKLFEICFSFCYTTDVPKRVSFECYVRALAFCFPSEPNQCLSTAVVSKLLELAQIIQEGKLVANFGCLQINGTNQFFGELLQIIESRRYESYLVEIIDQTARLASVDAEHAIKDMSLQSEQVISPVFVQTWMKLLKLTYVSNGFALALAKVDSSSCTADQRPNYCTADQSFLHLMPASAYAVPSQTINLSWPTTVCYFVSIFEYMKRNGSEFSLHNDKERLHIFFNHLKQFCNHRNVTVTSLKLLAATSITNEVFREVLDQLFCNERVAIDFREEAFQLVFEVLSLLPDGEMVTKVLTFWREVFSDDPGYQGLVYLLTLFVKGLSSEKPVVSQERAERILDFLEWLPRPLLLLISFWKWFLSWFIKILPTTFQRRPEVLAFIHKAVLALRVPPKQRLAYISREQLPTLLLFAWISQQSCTEEIKSEMICLLVCSSGEAEGLYWMFPINTVIKSLGLCSRLPFSTKKHMVRQLTYLAPFFKEREKIVLRNFVENIASNQTLEFMEEILCEFLEFIKRFVDERRPKTIPEDILTLLSLLSRVSISCERRVKVMQLSKKSRKGLLSGLRILQLVYNHQYVLNERTNEYFDLVFAAIVDTLKQDSNLCQQLYNQHRCKFPSTDVLKVWTFAVTGLLSLGLFKEGIDSQCCCPVLRQAYGFSPIEILQLLFQVRTTAVKLVHLSRRQMEATSSSNALHTREIVLLESFVTSVRIVLSTPALSSLEKLLLVNKVCDFGLSTPHILTTATFRNALINYIPWEHRISSNNEGMHLAIYHIVDILDNPQVLKQLSRIPLDGMRLSNSLCSVLSTKMSNSFSSVNVMDIFLIFIFISSLQDVDQAFFDHLLPFVKVAVKASTSGEDVLEHLKELVHVLRNIRSEMIPLTMLNFAYFIENPVNKQERDRFLKEVAMRWELPPSWRVFSFLEVPRLLWKAYNTGSTPAKRRELIDRVQEILKKRNKVREDWMMENVTSDSVYWFELFGGIHPRDYEYIKRRIACCELEWLVLHSSLSNKAAALAFDLSCLSFQLLRPRHGLKCLTVSDVQIEDGIFKFAVPRENETASADNRSTLSVAVASTGNVSPSTESNKPILTPVLMAQQVIHHLTRVLGQEEDPSENAFLLWELIFQPRELDICPSGCESNCSFLDDCLHAFLSILEEASSIEMMFHWAGLDQHHVCQCSEVIMKACKCNGDDIDKEALLKLQTVVSTTLAKMRSLPWTGSYTAPCFQFLKAELKQLGNILESRLPIEVTMKVLDLYQMNVQAGITVGEIVSLWACKQEALALVENFQSFCEGDEGSSLNVAQSVFVWQLLKAFGRFCKDSCEDLLAWFKELFVLHDPEDIHGFNSLPQWRETMITDGFPSRAIDSWCTAFLMTPLNDLTSRDFDAIIDLDSRSLQIVTSASQIIKRVIFPEDGFQVTKGKGIKERPIKERIRLARLLGEFINILKLRKPEENPKDAVVRDIVVDACDKLCKSHENENKRNDLYKIRDKKLKDLFTEVFDKRCLSEGAQVSIQDCGMTLQAGEEEPRVVESVTRQASHMHQNLPSVLSHPDVYEPMRVLLRRWLSGIVTKPTLAPRTLEIVQLLFSVHSSEVGPDELHDIIQTRILSFERNQSLMAQLQVSGYNQRGQDTPDLWSSRTVELPCYLSKRESPNSRLFTKKLVEVLRRLWNEWKDILFRVQKESIKVGNADVRTRDLFGVQASLEEMEKQAAAVKEVVKQIISEDLDSRRVQQLIREEQRHRARIEKLYKSSESQLETVGREKDELKKFVVVWENRFLEQVKMCSERIPGCYAPNGLHSEKPVLCALSVDNKILTVFKEEKGRREEVENVEVKLFEAGMYVYGLHTSGHDYVTDELWAAFYQMLLEKRLVPSIVLSNESPGFDWIKKFVQPATSHLCPLKWELHNGIVPREEDYFDHTPISAALLPDFQFLTLTRENVSSFQFSDLKEVNIAQEKEKQTQEMTGKAIQELQRELHVLHRENEPIKRALAGKLAFAVRKTVKSIVDEVQPTEESVKELIDMERLAFKHPEVERTEERRAQYAAAVLRACEHACMVNTSLNLLVERQALFAGHPQVVATDTAPTGSRGPLPLIHSNTE